MLAFVFPGQGSQQKGMGKGLFDEIREFSRVEEEVDAILGYSVRALCLEDRDNKLTQTEYTQPALYVVNALHYYKALSKGIRPHYIAGHSLGEYNALLAAGVFDLVTGLRLVKKRGELMAQATGGAMAAVVGLRSDHVARIRLEHDLLDVDVANFNSPTQTVISGPIAEIKRAAAVFLQAGASSYVPLPVSAAFHSRHMMDAARRYADFLAPMSFAPPRVPVVANATAELYEADGNAVKYLLVEQITHSVLWKQSINYLLSQGVVEFEEMGPGTVLTRVIQQVRRDSSSEWALPAGHAQRGFGAVSFQA